MEEEKDDEIEDGERERKMGRERIRTMMMERGVKLYSWRRKHTLSFLKSTIFIPLITSTNPTIK